MPICLESCKGLVGAHANGLADPCRKNTLKDVVSGLGMSPQKKASLHVKLTLQQYSCQEQNMCHFWAHDHANFDCLST